MATTTTSVQTDWRQEWFEIEDATYLNLAGQSPMPKISIRAVQAALEAKKYPHHKPDSTFFEVPNRIRASIAKLIGGKPEEVALTSGASAGVAAVAYGLTWKQGDEVITAKGEFPLQYTAWKPMEEREGLKLKIVSPRERFIRADDLIAAISPRTRIVSVSMVRYDDGSLLDAARVADACHKQGALLLLDASQCCGAIPMDVSGDFVVRMGPELVAAHNRKLIELMFDRLPKDRFVPASPLDAARRGPYGCFAARSPEKTAEHYQHLRNENVVVSLREGNIRVSPHLYNTERDIDRLISVVTP